MNNQPQGVELKQFLKIHRVLYKEEDTARLEKIGRWNQQCDTDRGWVPFFETDDTF